jgi:hypothetical protein
MNRILFGLCIALCLFALEGVQANGLLAPGDPILGGVLSGDQFQVGVAGTAAGVNNWPAAEPPEDLINGIIGGGGEKYLNFAELNTGVIVTPTALTGGNPTVATSIDFWVANDAVERDPANYALYGTNSAISGGGPFALANFSLIASGDLALPSDRDMVADSMGFSQTVSFGNAATYLAYMLIFPNVKDAAAANSMQISEVQLHGQVIPEPSALTLAALACCLGFLRRRQ